MKNTSTKIALAVSCLALVAMAAGVGAYVGQTAAAKNVVQPQTPMMLKADTAARGKSMSMATGFIDRNRSIEGLFVLDHLSGVLQCWLVNPRTGEIAGIYAADVNEHLELQKGGENDYVMTTGNFEIDGRRNNANPADCICYVGDGSTGKVVVFSLFYDSQLIPQNREERGELVVIARGLAREAGLKRD